MAKTVKTAAPDARTVEEETRKLQRDRFQNTHQMLLYMERLRLRQEEPNVPPEYDKTAVRWKTPLINQQGREMVRMLMSKLVPRVTPPPDSALQSNGDFRQQDTEEPGESVVTEMQEHDPQAVATKIEKWCDAMREELECYCDHARRKAVDGQVFKGRGWIKTMPRRDWYKYAKGPGRNATPEQLQAFNADYEKYKKTVNADEAMIYMNVPAETMLPVGQPAYPDAVYEVKLVDELTMMKRYSLDKQGGEYTTLPAGTSETRPVWAGNKVHVIEYWDDTWALIIIGSQSMMTGTGINAPVDKDVKHTNKTPFMVDSFKHNYGRVPYFFFPGIETDAVKEEDRFQSPLWELYAEAPYNNQMRTMHSNVSWLTGFPSMVIETQPDNDLILDEKTHNPKTYIEFKPGMMHQLKPGQKVAAMPFVVNETFEREMVASDARMDKYSLSQVAKGSSPGADTANAALATLRRLLKDTLDELAMNQAQAWREIYRFWVRMVRDYFKETVYARHPTTGDQIGLSPDDVVTLALDVTLDPDIGSDMLLIEKHMAELVGMGLYDDLAFYEAAGKENPEEWARRAMQYRGRRVMEPELWQQMMANFGLQGAIQKMIAANQSTGDARNAIPELLQGLQSMQNGQPTGMGQGSGGQPRSEGVRSPAVQETTQPETAGVQY